MKRRTAKVRKKNKLDNKKKLENEKRLSNKTNQHGRKSDCGRILKFYTTPNMLVKILINWKPTFSSSSFL